MRGGDLCDFLPRIKNHDFRFGIENPLNPLVGEGQGHAYLNLSNFTTQGNVAWDGTSRRHPRGIGTMTSELDMGKLDMLGFGEGRSSVALDHGDAVLSNPSPRLQASNTGVYLLLFVALTGDTLVQALTRYSATTLRRQRRKESGVNSSCQHLDRKGQLASA